MTVERIAPRRDAGEREMLLAWLDYHRATLLAKCEGLSPEQLRVRSCPPSTLSLLGLVRHMTDVERGWFRRGVGGDDVAFVFDYDADPDAEFNQVDSADASADLARYRNEIEACRAVVAAQPSLERTFGDGDRRTNVRWVLLHMIEEYARHNGHADLLRERIDGVTGD